MSINKHLLESLADQASSSSSIGGGRKAVKRWIEKNIAHPRHENQKWSWAGHEYQIAICQDQHPWVACQKAAQVGVSELSLSITLALLSVMPNSNVIYTLMNNRYARVFGASRFDPAIRRSPKLQALRNADVDSTSLKQIGSSYLHITGGHSESSAISIPASALIVDEVSFISREVLGAYASRLEHLPEEEKILIQFSTPLYSDSGISAIYDQGDQKVYMVLHERCNQWTDIDPVRDYIIPKCEIPLKKFDTSDLDKYDIDKAYVKCSHCGNEITRQNLADPDKRAWVPTYLERSKVIGLPSTYQVLPTDVSAIKSLPQIIRSLSLYKTPSRFFQFGLGLPYDEAGGQISNEACRNAFTGEHIPFEKANNVYNCVLGADIGKTSHMVIARREGKNLVVLEMKSIKQGFSDELQTSIYNYYLRYNCLKGIADSQPDFSSVRAIQGKLPDGAFLAAYFVKSISGSLFPFEIKGKDGMVAIVRTRILDAFIEDFNKGRIILPRFDHDKQKEITNHLRSVKKVTELDGIGEESVKYVKMTGVDHWLFSLLYAYVAAEMIAGFGQVIVMPSVKEIVGKVRMPWAVGGRG
jgi:hypothetical protein